MKSYRGKLAIDGGMPAVKTPLPHFIWPVVGKEEILAINNYLKERKPISILDDSGIYSELEQKINKYYKTRFSILTNSGTSALHSAFFALGINRGDEIIAPSNTFRTTVTPILQCGGTPILCDCDYSTGCISPEDIIQKITQKTRAIIVTHLWGHPAQITEIHKIAREYNLKLIEDCSHAHGTTYLGKRVGTFGDVGCFSMQANKLVYAGEGGFLITNNREIYERAILLGHSGAKARQVVRTKKYKKFAETGYGLKYRIHPLAAVIAKIQLDRQDKRINQCQKNMNYLAKQLKKFDFMQPEENKKEVEKRTYFSFVTKYKKQNLANIPTSKFIKILKAEGIQITNDNSAIKPLHLQPLFQTKKDEFYLHGPGVVKRTHKEGDFPITEKYFETTVHFPPFVEPAAKIIDEYISALKKIEIKLV